MCMDENFKFGFLYLLFYSLHNYRKFHAVSLAENVPKAEESVL